MSIEDRCESRRARKNHRTGRAKTPPGVSKLKTPNLKPCSVKGKPLPPDSPYLHHDQGSCYCQGCIEAI